MQTIHIHFEIGKWVALGDQYKNQTITKAVCLRSSTGITSIWLTIQLNYGVTKEYRHKTMVEAIQHINDCIYHNLHKSIAETSYGITPVEIVIVDPLMFDPRISQAPTMLDRLVKG